MAAKAHRSELAALLRHTVTNTQALPLRSSPCRPRAAELPLPQSGGAVALPAGAVGGSVTPGTAAASSAWLPWAAQAAWPATGATVCPSGWHWVKEPEERGPAPLSPAAATTRPVRSAEVRRRGFSELFPRTESRYVGGGKMPWREDD